MAGQRGLFLVGVVVLGACVTGALLGEDVTEPAAEAAAVPQEPADGQMVRMAEVTQLQGRRVEGRIVHEDDERIDLEQPGGSVTGYAKHMIRPDIRRFTISKMAWVEMGGDLRQSGALDSPNPSTELLKALHAYEQARLLATSPEDRKRLDAKADTVLQMQDAWHAESVRRQDLEIMTQQAELLKLQQQLTREKLAALDQQRQEIVRLHNELGRLQAQNRDLATYADNLAEAITELQDDMDDLQNLDQFFVRTNVFVQL